MSEFGASTAAAACLLPGVEDANHFRERQSVNFWRSWSAPSDSNEWALRVTRGLSSLRSASERRRLLFSLGASMVQPLLQQQLRHRICASLFASSASSAIAHTSETADVLLQDIACQRSGLYRARAPWATTRAQQWRSAIDERATAERRSGLVAMHEHSRGKAPKRLAVIDAGCGSGQLLGDMRLSHPSAAFTALDISASQLALAQREAEESGADARAYVDATSLGPVEYVQEPASKISSPSAAFDIAILSHVVHELDSVKEREDVMAELARVLKPNGLLVLISPLQVGDRPRLGTDVLDKQLYANAKLQSCGSNEPAGAYSKHSLGALGQSVGLAPEYKEMRGMTKALSFRRMVHRSSV